MKKFIQLALFHIIFIGVVYSTPVSAESADFSVEAVIPENQIDNNLSYFDLKIQPGQTQDMKVKLRNNTDKEITVEAEANTAITNDNGIIDYSYSKDRKDSTLKVPFSEIATVNKETKIPAHSELPIKIKLQMPETQYDGVILGGLRFIKKEDTNKENAQIKNRYSYTIGVVLSETDTSVEPEVKLNEITPTQINFRNVVTANIQNINSVIIKNLSVHAKVYKAGSNEILHQTEKKHLSMAPNSNFNYAIDWDNQPFKDGKYRLELVAKSGDKIWEFKREFEIKQEVAEKYNDRAVELKKDYTWVYVTIVISITLTLLMIISILAYRLKKKRTSEN